MTTYHDNTTQSLEIVPDCFIIVITLIWMVTLDNCWNAMLKIHNTSMLDFYFCINVRLHMFTDITPGFGAMALLFTAVKACLCSLGLSGFVQITFRDNTTGQTWWRRAQEVEVTEYIHLLTQGLQPLTDWTEYSEVKWGSVHVSWYFCWADHANSSSAPVSILAKTTETQW